MHPLDSLASTNLGQHRRSREGDLGERLLARVAMAASAAQSAALKRTAAPAPAITSGCPTVPRIDGSATADAV